MGIEIGYWLGLKSWLPSKAAYLVEIGAQDTFLWQPSKNLKFSCKETWEAIRKKLLWFPFAIPRHSFFLAAGNSGQSFFWG